MSSKVEEALASVGEPGASAFIEHLKGGTSAVFLSDWLRRAGHPVGATTLKDYRKRLNT